MRRAAGRDAGLGRKPEIAADSPKRAKEDIEHRFGELKASGVGSAETNREIAERLELLGDLAVHLRRPDARGLELGEAVLDLLLGALRVPEPFLGLALLLEERAAVPLLAQKLLDDLVEGVDARRLAHGE